MPAGDIGRYLNPDADPIREISNAVGDRIAAGWRGGITATMGSAAGGRRQIAVRVDRLGRYQDPLLKLAAEGLFPPAKRTYLHFASMAANRWTQGRVS